MYNLHSYKKKNNKIFRYTLITLNLILIILISYILIKTHMNKTKATETFKQQKIIQLKANTEVQNWDMKAQVLKDELQRQNELIALEGQREVKYTFDYTKNELKSKQYKWLVDKINQLKTKEITVHTVYNYIFAYDLSKIDVEVQDNKLHILLSRNDIHLKPIAEDSSQRVISDETRILSGEFTPQEVSAILNMIMVDAHNNITNDNKLYSLALMNTKTDIEELAKKLGIKDIEFQVIDIETIENNDIEVLNDNNK